VSGAKHAVRGRRIGQQWNQAYEMAHWNLALNIFFKSNSLRHEWTALRDPALESGATHAF